MSSTTNPNVIVIGAGLAGLSAAVRAAELGLSVHVLEASSEDLYLCNSRYTGGLFHIAMDNMRDDPEITAERVGNVTGGEMDKSLAKALAENAERTVWWLRRQGVTLIKAGPDGLRKNALAPPGAKRTGLHWRGRSGDVMLRALAKTLDKRKGKLMRASRAVSLIMDNERCVGVKFVKDDVTHEVRSEAVVLADGGFQANLELLGRYVSPAPSKLLMRNACTGCGDGIKMAEKVNAKLVGMGSFYGHIQYRYAIDDQRFWPYPVLDSLATAGIIINEDGDRFCDEGLGGVYVTNKIARLKNPLGAYIIFDDSIWNGPGKDWLLPANPYLITAGGSLISAESIEKLAERIGVDAARLRTTIFAYNSFIATEGSLEPPRTRSQYKAWPIRSPTLYALPVCAGVTYTMGGLLTDDKGRVLSQNNEPIEGLLAAGATTGGLEGGGFAGYSGGLSKSAVFGMITGETAAKICERRSRCDAPL